MAMRGFLRTRSTSARRTTVAAKPVGARKVAANANGVARGNSSGTANATFDLNSPRPRETAMGDLKQTIIAARETWWNGIAKQGDPIRRPNLTWEAFEAGYRAALAAMQEPAAREGVVPPDTQRPDTVAVDPAHATQPPVNAAGGEGCDLCDSAGRCTYA